MKKTLALTLLLVAAGLAAAVSARSAARATELTATVGPGFSISLMENGVRVTNLDPGDYTITVDDKATEHNFHLFGPGVNESTTVDGTGQTTWNVTFQKGSYEYVCDAHVATMVGKFTVGAPAVPAALKVRAVARAVKRVVTVRASASRAASYDLSLWLGTKRVAHGGKPMLRYVARKPGRYVAKVVAKTADGATARAAASVRVR